MFLYTVIVAIAALLVGLLIAVLTKKDPSVIYSKQDKAGRITNIVLTVIYLVLSPLYLFIGMIARPHYDGILGLLGWIVSILMASTAVPCFVGIGLSVAFRKKGKSKWSFLAQFAGLAGIALTLILFFLLYGNLLKPLN